MHHAKATRSTRTPPCNLVTWLGRLVKSSRLNWLIPTPPRSDQRCATNDREDRNEDREAFREDEEADAHEQAQNGRDQSEPPDRTQLLARGDNGEYFHDGIRHDEGTDEPRYDIGCRERMDDQHQADDDIQDAVSHVPARKPCRFAFTHVGYDVHDTSEDEASASYESDAQKRDARIERTQRAEEDEQHARYDERPILFCFFLGSHSLPLSLFCQCSAERSRTHIEHREVCSAENKALLKGNHASMDAPDMRAIIKLFDRKHARCGRREGRRELPCARSYKRNRIRSRP